MAGDHPLLLPNMTQPDAVVKTFAVMEALVEQLETLVKT